MKKIYLNTKEVFKDSVHEHDWMFYRDALSLTTSNECKSFMEREVILTHWLLPQNGVNARTIYAYRPIGNTPELIPMDCNLNRDIHEGAMRHVAFTSRLAKNYPRKFSIATPKQGARD